MREDLLAAVGARLEQADTTQDLSPVLEPGALAEAQGLTQIVEDDEGDLQGRYALGWLHWYRYQAQPEGQEHQDLDAAIGMLLPCFIADAEGLPEPLLPILAAKAAPAAFTLFEQALSSPDQDLISAVVNLWQRILDASPTDHPGRTTYLFILGGALRTRFERSGALADLDALIEAEGAAVADTPADDPGRAAYLFKLGVALRTRFEHTAVPGDLDEAIEADRAAVADTLAGHPDRATYLSNLGVALETRFERTGALGDLDAAIEAFEAAAAETPAGHPDQAGFLSNLGIALQIRFERTGVVGDLDAAIEAIEAAAAGTPIGHSNRAMYLFNLGAALATRSRHSGVSGDLDAAIEAIEAAVAETPPGHPDGAGRLFNLGIALRTRFEFTGVLGDLDAAIEAIEAAAADTPAGHPDRAKYLSNLGIALKTRFERTGVLGDLDAAIEVGRAAVADSPAGHSNSAASRFDLGAALVARFERTGVLGDLDAAIEAIEAALRDSSPGQLDRAASLSNLGAALLARFVRTGALADLDAAIEAIEAALRDSSPGQLDRAKSLSNLGAALGTRFERTGVLGDLDAAIEAIEAAAADTSAGHPDRAKYLSNLGIALETRFEHTGTLADLDAAIEVGRAAVADTPVGHPNRAMYLSNLGVALRTKFKRTWALGDLDAAIEVGRAAVADTPVGHPNRAAYLFNLGVALRNRFRRTGARADLDAALSVYVQAVEVDSAAPSVRIRAAHSAAALVAGAEPGRAADLLKRAVLLLPEVTPRQLGRSDQQYAIGGFAGLASDAAALALADPGTPTCERAPRALRLLEAGRAVLLSLALETRSDLTDLRHRDPGLADRFIDLRDRLDQPEDTSPPSAPAGTTTLAALPGRVARDRRRLAEMLSATLVEIRALHGFASFGLPPAIDELLAQAVSGPVVTFNISEYRSDALLLTQDDITQIELAGLTYNAVIEQISVFHQALHAATSASTSSGRKAAQASLREILEWLWDTAAEPVLDAIGYRRQPQPGGVWPRVWWAPGGLLGLLPVHAAGYHTDMTGERGRRTVMDRVVSSYTPTIRALRYARQHSSVAVPAGRALIVAMPITPDVAGGLHHVTAEATMLCASLPHPVLLTEPGTPIGGIAVASERTPTKANVLSHLPGCAIAHFACHGASDPTDPSKSLLLLHDHDSDPLTVASLAPIKLDRAQLAYLSACRTAFTDAAELIDEAIHITSAFQLAGFPHVIGTMWEIDDARAVEVADSFYANLRASDGTLDTNRAADALHHAIRAARDKLPATPSLWAAYLHAGA